MKKDLDLPMKRLHCQTEECFKFRELASSETPDLKKDIAKVKYHQMNRGKRLKVINLSFYVCLLNDDLRKASSFPPATLPRCLEALPVRNLSRMGGDMCTWVIVNSWVIAGN